MGEHVVQKLSELQQLDANLHWFCPRSTADDFGLYLDEDILNEANHESEKDRRTRLQRVQAVESRRDAALEACKIFAFDGSDAKPYQDSFRKILEAQLGRCEICVREYHRARFVLIQRLEAEYDTEEVQQFIDTFDRLNIRRISEGLDKATAILEGLPTQQRNIKAIGDAGMYALFEALNCIPFLRDDQALQQHFDRPFRLVQTNKKLKLPNYAPGMIAFLFSNHQERSAWAARNTEHLKRQMTAQEFEYSVKPFLETAIARVHILALEREFLPVFWRATKLVVFKLNKDLVTNKLRTLDSNIYTVALEHFQIDDSHFSDLLNSYQKLIELSPKDFWEALGTINAQAVADTIFRSPTLQRLLKTRDEREPLHLDQKLQWTVVLVRSISAGNLVPPVRSMLEQLLRRLQDDQYSKYAQSVAWSTGLTCLLTALDMVSRQVKAGPLTSNMIQVVAQDHLDPILLELSGAQNKKTEMQISKDEQLCLDIVEQILTMDTAALHQDRITILKTAKIEHELHISGLDMWKRSMRLVRRGYPAIAASILSGIGGLLPLEAFPPRQVEKAVKPARGWNDALKRSLEYVGSDLLDRLDSFEYEDVLEVIQDPKGLEGIVRLLLNGDQEIHQGAVSVLKILSEADDRRGCLMHVLSVFYATAMPAFNRALDELAKALCFQPSRMTLKVCTDVFSCLCDSSDGILRSVDRPRKQGKVLEMFWMRVWQLLGMIFQQTENWSNLGYDKQGMQDFCREVMDFADYTFEQYSVIAGSLMDEYGNDSYGVNKILLEHARAKFSSISKWLRLRDDYLITKAVSLTAKMLARLGEVEVRIDEQAAQFIEGIVISTQQQNRVKTKLSMQQKAELRRALERHLGRSLSDTIDLEAEDRPKKQRNLEDWASSGRSSGASTPIGGVSQSARPGTIDVDAWSDAARRRKGREGSEGDGVKKLMGSMNASERLAQKKLQERQKKPVLNPATAKAAQSQQKDQQEFLAKRKRAQAEAEQARKAAAERAKGVGVGSGVLGLGDMGKDHTMKGKNVMVSSDEESEDDDEEDFDDGLFGPSVKKKVERPNVDPNGAVGLKPEVKTGPTKIQRTARSARDMRARLAPDLTSLHRVILGWDFFHDGDYPPGMNENQFRQVANSFNDPTTYQQTFQPLLTLEAWQGLVRAREETSSKPYEVRVANRTNVDAFIEISSIVGHAENRELQLQEADIILLSKAKSPGQDATAPHCLARIYRVKRQKAHCEIVYQLLPGSSLAPSLAGQTVVWGLKVQSITPLEREYGALQALQYYDLCNQIIRAKPSKRMNYSEKQITAYQDIWNVNKAQSGAINAALENEGFSLIQGPPGSGKTKTIVAIVGGLLTQVLSSSSSGTKISMPGGHGNGSLDAPPRKLLVCAPSNAAVDELVMRLKDGVKTKNGREHQLNVVRIGRSDAINSQVLDVTMDQLVSKRLGTSDVDQKQRESNAAVFKEHEKVSSHLRDLYQKRDSGTVKGPEQADLENEISSTRKRKNELGVKIDNAKDQERNAGREAELNRKKAQQAVLDEAHVICATLSGSGHDMFQSLNIEFETVIIDEAAQCVEMSSLIPLKYGCVKCIMVGDPKQLPPTVFSKEAAKFQYEQSLFVRMQNNFSNEVHLLDTQYRMHPDISVFPSQTFYDGLLKDGRGMLELRQRPWHASTMLAPYRFFDVSGQHQAAPRGHSLVNTAEIEIAMALYNRLRTDFTGYDFDGRIGIITPYKSQLKMLKERFSQRYGSDILEMIEFNTTDAFQGRESEIIIFSCVRASPAGGIGFLQDIRRMNVGLTRAKSSLWVLGNSDSLIRGQFWKKLVEDARARDCYTSGNLKAMLGRPSSVFPAQRGAAVRSMPDAGAHVPQMQDAPTTSSTAVKPRQGSMNGNSGSKADRGDRMEGVSYKFADRIKKMKDSPDAGGDGSTPLPPLGKIPDASVEPQDVEMSNADSPESRGATPGSNVSGAETSLPAGERQSSNPADGNAKPRAGAAARSVAPQVKKRPAASPFMPPRKHPKPRP
ncbi:DEAD-box type RNA helicase [Saxophila tyrrhenica]|uniref:DEAD-box type RNA helicase n=1 Tax=Saxophila tyrrhenica TaxID=1690608 RepID=A0AAV9PR85_9PEZI|nr:DEAD-box type RNA helicase [Saxophila tyrrhenica]